MNFIKNANIFGTISKVTYKESLIGFKCSLFYLNKTTQVSVTVKEILSNENSNRTIVVLR